MNIETAAVEHARSVPPYQAGMPISTVAREMGLEESSIVKLASNENPLGMSPRAREAVARAAEDPARYPDPDCYELRGVLAADLGIEPDRILFGAGSTEILILIARAFLTQGRNAIVPQMAFTVYESATKSAAGTAKVIPHKDYGHDLDAMANAIDASTGVVFVSSPNNPTGSRLDNGAVENFLERVPSDVVVVFDEAYREFIDPEHRPDVKPWLDRFPNLLVLRTFSKIYGLAGLRAGYALGNPEVINLIQRLRSPFSVSVPAQAAAVAAIQDKAFVETSYRLNAEERIRVGAALDEGKVTYLPSAANFFAIKVGDGPTTYRELLKRGIVVRPLGNWGLPGWLRVTIGTKTENDRFLAALRDVLPNGTPAA